MENNLDPNNQGDLQKATRMFQEQWTTPSGVKERLHEQALTAVESLKMANNSDEYILKNLTKASHLSIRQF